MHANYNVHSLVLLDQDIFVEGFLLARWRHNNVPARLKSGDNVDFATFLKINLEYRRKYKPLCLSSANTNFLRICPYELSKISGTRFEPGIIEIVFVLPIIPHFNSLVELIVRATRQRSHKGSINPVYL